MSGSQQIDTDLLRAEVQHLREMLTQRMDARDRLIDERFASQAVALKLEAAEVARRLEVLNGEAGRLAEMQATYVPREVHTSEFAQLRLQVDELKLHQAQSQGKGVAYAPLISLGIAIIAVLVGFYLSQQP